MIVKNVLELLKQNAENVWTQTNIYHFQKKNVDTVYLTSLMMVLNVFLVLILKIASSVHLIKFVSGVAKQ